MGTMEVWVWNKNNNFGFFEFNVAVLRQSTIFVRGSPNRKFHRLTKCAKNTQIIIYSIACFTFLFLFMCLKQKHSTREREKIDFIWQLKPKNHDFVFLWFFDKSLWSGLMCVLICSYALRCVCLSVSVSSWVAIGYWRKKKLWCEHCRSLPPAQSLLLSLIFVTVFEFFSWNACKLACHTIISAEKQN